MDGAPEFRLDEGQGSHELKPKFDRQHRLVANAVLYGLLSGFIITTILDLGDDDPYCAPLFIEPRLDST